MKGRRNVGLLVIGAIVVILLLWGCGGYNGLVSADQNVKKVWGNVETNYQRRTDLYSSVIKTVEALIDDQGRVRLLEPVKIARTQRALVTILEEEPAPDLQEITRLSESALAEDWNRPEEDSAWLHLQSAK